MTNVAALNIAKEFVEKVIKPKIKENLKEKEIRLVGYFYNYVGYSLKIPKEIFGEQDFYFDCKVTLEVNKILSDLGYKVTLEKFKTPYNNPDVKDVVYTISWK